MEEFDKKAPATPVPATPAEPSIERDGGLLRFPMTPGRVESDGHGRITFPMPK